MAALSELYDRWLSDRQPQKCEPKQPTFTLCDGCGSNSRTSSMSNVDRREGLFCAECARALAEIHARIDRPEYRLAMRVWGDNATAVEMADCIAQAAAEGRLDQGLADLLGVDTGQHHCPVCGMRNWTDASAEACCYPAQPGVPDIRESATW